MEPIDTSHVAAKGARFLLTAFVIAAIVRYVFQISLGWLLPVEQYGIFGIAVSLLGILLPLVSWGFPFAVAKLLPDDGIEEERKLKIFKCSLTGNFLMSMVFCSLFWVIYTSFLRWGEAYNSLIFIMIAVALVASIKSVYLKALEGFLKFRNLAALQAAEPLLIAASGIGLVFGGFGVKGALSGYLIAGLIVSATVFYLLRHFSFWKAKGWTEMRIIYFAAPMFIGMIALGLLEYIDIQAVKILTAKDVSEQLAGYYQAALVFARTPLLLTLTAMGAVFPLIAKYHATKGGIYPTFAFKYGVLFVIPIALFISSLARFIIPLFYPDAYAMAAQALTIISLGMGFLALAFIVANSYQALGSPAISAMVLWSSVVIQVILLYLLIPQLGIVGAAASTTIACFLAMVVLVSKGFRDSLLKLRRGEVIKSIISLIMLATFLYLFPKNNVLLITLCLILAILGYLFLLLLLHLITKEDIDVFSSAFPQYKWLVWILDRAKQLMTTFQNK